MSLFEWLSLAVICILGAMSPGPSLAMVVKHTLSGGRGHGIAASVAHGFGVGIYALITVFGLAVLITESEFTFQLLKYAGAIFLAFLGVKALLNQQAPSFAKPQTEQHSTPISLAIRDGLLIAILNPKILIFFTALFSQFVDPVAGIGQRLGMALLVASTDTLWYLLIAVAMSQTAALNWLRSKAQVIDKVFGIILIVLAIRVVFS